MERYTAGLLADIPRKTASDLGRGIAGTNGQRLQEFLTNTEWDSREMDLLRVQHMLAHSFLSLRRNDSQPPQPDFTAGPRQFPSATPVARFPPKGRQSLAALRRSIHEEFFIQVIEAAIRTNDGPFFSHLNRWFTA